ncbi:hypothetical protein GCM10023189_15960 [Nibrella saemangeumensis]|uniref:Methane oxygenase PmoA n=1 Tax=Nibrella saemangeumensis TaxID=1084526 RepID=A0ABP8MLG9_9BACT
MTRLVTFCLSIVLLFGGGIAPSKAFGPAKPGSGKIDLRIEHDGQAGTISVYRVGEKTPILTQHARPDTRPYIHPIVAPDGKGVLTEHRPKHHLHQTGLYWGLKEVNGRDYFMNWQGDYYRRVSATVTRKKGRQVSWQTVYDLIDAQGNTLLTETQNWSMQEEAGKYLLDLEWRGNAKTTVNLGKFYVGGLFIRMPWQPGINGEVVNAVGQTNKEAEGQRAIWTDVGIQVEGRSDPAHIAIFDHPDNRAFPTPWRVDNELGVGPSVQILGDWRIEPGQTEVIRYRLLAYSGALKDAGLTRQWKEFVRAY